MLRVKAETITPQADLKEVSLHCQTLQTLAITCKTLQPQWVATTDMNDCC
jgi:hypothetical protein